MEFFKEILGKIWYILYPFLFSKQKPPSPKVNLVNLITKEAYLCSFSEDPAAKSAQRALHHPLKVQSKSRRSPLHRKSLYLCCFPWT